MIDIITSDDGVIRVAHDLEDLGHVSELLLDQANGNVQVRLADGRTQSLGVLSEKMLELARKADAAEVIAMDGWESFAPYACTLSRIQTS